MKPYIKDEKKQRTEFIKTKWYGSQYAESLERTHQMLIELVQVRWETLNIPQRIHFQNKIDWEKRWRKKWEEEQYLP